MRYFCAIAETGSLTKASGLLGISHSGLSKAISSLEDETKLKLFIPSGRGLEITPEGKWFYQKARDILQIYEGILIGVKPTPNVLQLGLSEVFAITCAGILAEEFSEPLKIFEEEIGDVESKILSGALDFGIVFSPSPKSDLEYLEVAKVRFRSYGRKDLVQRMAAFELPFVIPSQDFPSNPLGYKTRDGWPIKVPRNPVFSVSHFAIALNLVRSGRAIAYMPEFVAALENEADWKDRIIPVEDHRAADSTRPVYLVKGKSVAESKNMKRLTKKIRQICSMKP